jgi:hypothetical protein
LSREKQRKADQTMSKPHDQLSEKASESGIVAALSASPMYRERPATAFDVATMLDAEELAAFVQATQPKEWAKLAKQFPGAERGRLAASEWGQLSLPSARQNLHQRFFGDQSCRQTSEHNHR